MNTDKSLQLSAEAWLLSIDNELNAAIGKRELRHVAHSPVTFTIPFCPFYCDQVLIWNNQLLPVIDLASWLTDGQQICRSDLVGIVAYLGHDAHMPSYAGLRIYNAPKRIQVYDDQACALPKGIPRWRSFATSAFRYKNDKPVPILDLPSIFSYTPHPEVQQEKLGKTKDLISPQI